MQGKQENQKNYNKSKKVWQDFKIHPDIIDALRDNEKTKPTRVQEETLQLTTNPDRKKFNVLIRSVNGSGKTLSFLIPILNTIQPGLKIVEDKIFKGKNMPNQIFHPQAIIIVQTSLLQEQIENQLKIFQKYGEEHKSEKLKFKIGRMDKEIHQFGDIMIVMPTSFLNRHSRGNMKFDNCKFVAIDEVDDTYEHNKNDLEKILMILEESPANVITCSATMKKDFIDFYGGICKDFISKNLISIIGEELKEKITLQGVQNFYKVFTGGRIQMHTYIVKEIFKSLYDKKEEKKPQVFIFFNSSQEINEFYGFFKSLSEDFTNNQSEYLQPLNVDILAGKIYKDSKVVEATIQQKRDVMGKFRNDEINVLLCTNIIARGIDVRNACFVINVGAPLKTEKSQQIDVDIYLHRVGRTGRHNDEGVALTLVDKQQKQNLVNRVEKVHKITIQQLKSPEEVVTEVARCIKKNSE